jgi:hypothetical protein
MGGYFVSFLVTHLLNFILSLRRLLKISGCSIDPKTPLMAAMATAGTICAAGFVTHPALRFLACSMMLGSLLFLLRVLTGEDICWIRNLIRKK